LPIRSIATSMSNGRLPMPLVLAAFLPGGLPDLTPSPSPEGEGL